MAQIGRKGGESRQSAARANAEKNAGAGTARSGAGSEQSAKTGSRQGGKSDS